MRAVNIIIEIRGYMGRCGVALDSVKRKRMLVCREVKSGTKESRRASSGPEILYGRSCSGGRCYPGTFFGRCISEGRGWEQR